MCLHVPIMHKSDNNPQQWHVDIFINHSQHWHIPLDKETPVFINSFHGFVLSVKLWYFSGFVNEMQTAHDNPTYKNQLVQGYW